jgi:hypothetical protein
VLSQGLAAVQLHVPLWHELTPVHPHVWATPQLSATVPHATPSQGLGAVHPQTLAEPAPPHVCKAPQAVVPQSTSLPQLLVVFPHCTLAQVTATSSSTQPHRVGGPPVQTWPAAHAEHVNGSAQPWLLSVGTHAPLQFFVFGPQVPMTHAVPLQTRVSDGPCAAQFSTPQPDRLHP